MASIQGVMVILTAINEGRGTEAVGKLNLADILVSLTQSLIFW